MTTKTFARGELVTDALLHPGEFLADELAGRGWVPARLTEAMGTDIATVDSLLACRKRISGSLAIRLESALGIPAHVWIDLQGEYDLARARKAKIRTS